MNLGLVMRSPKFRILLYIITFGGACLMVMLLHNMHSHLKEAENSFAVCQQEKEKCDQGKDSISAQFQVLSEHKKRLEVTLQQERLEHQKEKEGFEKKSIETQAVHSQLQKEMNELQSRYSQLSSDYKSLKETNEQIQTQLADMKESYASLEKEKQNLNLELSTQLQQLHQQEEEVSQLNGQLKMVLMEKQQIEQENAERIKCESNLVSCRKEHQQLMIQFDEVSLNLSNCIIGKNNSKQEILNHPHEHVTRYVKNNIALDAVQKTKQEEEQKDKIVHEEVGKKANQQSDITESEKATEKLVTTDDIIGSEFNDTLLSNSSSVLFVGNINVDNNQVDMQATGKSNLQETNSQVSQPNRRLDVAVRKVDVVTKMVDVESSVRNPPLPEPHITNTSKTKEMNGQIVSTKSTHESATQATQASSKVAPEIHPSKIPQSDYQESSTGRSPLAVSDQNQEKGEVTQAQSHLENLMKKIQSGDVVVQKTLHNSRFPSSEDEKPQDYAYPVKEEPNAKMPLHKYVSLGNDLYTKRYDGNWIQNYNREDNPPDNVQDDEYGDDRGMDNMTE